MSKTVIPEFVIKGLEEIANMEEMDGVGPSPETETARGVLKRLNDEGYQLPLGISVPTKFQYVERREEPAARCWQRRDGSFEIEYWDGMRCILSPSEAKERPVKVGRLNPVFPMTYQCIPDPM